MRDIFNLENLNLLLLIMMSFVLFIYILGMFNKDKKAFTIMKYIFISLLLLYGLIIIFIKLSTPKINLLGNDTVEISINAIYRDEGYQLLQFNNRIYSKVIVKSDIDFDAPGTYKIKYILNYFGEQVIKERKVIVKDDATPLMILYGDKNITMFLNQEYVEPGYMAIDNIDGDITKSVVVESNLKNEIGTYEINYSITDSNNNKRTEKRTITVKDNDKGVIYLTFDDGPSAITEGVLDILKEENVKATFFVVNFDSSMESVVKRIVNEGHTIALHTYTHRLDQIYRSENEFFDDITKIQNRVKEVTGVESKIIRFAGGSSNTRSSYNKGIMSRLVKEVINQGYHYFDWNVSSRDAEGAKNSTEVYNSVITTLSKNRSNVVIMHDHKYCQKTLNALKDVIETAKSQGYTFDKITFYTHMVKHGVFN